MPTYVKKLDVEFEYRVQYPDMALGELMPAVMVWVSSIGGVDFTNTQHEIQEELCAAVQHEIEDHVAQGGM